MEDSPIGIEFTGTPQEQLQWRLMLAFAALGSIRKKVEDAELVYAALEAQVTDKAGLILYRAMSLAVGGEAKISVELMTTRVTENPDDDMAKVALGVSMLLVDDPEWKFTIDNVLATSMDQTARQAALKTMTYVPAMLSSAGRGTLGTMRPA